MPELQAVVLTYCSTQEHIFRYLGGVRSFNHQDTPELAQAVLDLLSRIEHGILTERLG
ncbi:hypothetical protein D3C76_1773480 [compost metagenome]